MAAKRNKGTTFERALEAIFHCYQRSGRAKIHKVDPPIRVIHGPPKRIIPLENYHLDFAGTWTELGGRMIIIEAKWTEDRRLRIGRTGGITENQIANMRSWEKAGAATAAVWGSPLGMKMVSLDMIDERIQATERVSLRWCDAVTVPPGATPEISHDILGCLEGLAF
tara:strand:- start:35106 stop:35606 length:501 start_codon:yes stop_codon:yes gene_type:complete